MCLFVGPPYYSQRSVRVASERFFILSRFNILLSQCTVWSLALE